MASTDGEKDMAKMADQDHIDRLQKDIETVKSELAALTGQITKALNNVAGTAQKTARRGYSQAKANVDSLVSDAAERGGAALDAAHDAATTMEETLEEAIAERPIAAVGLALGLGLLIGMTWRR